MLIGNINTIPSIVNLPGQKSAAGGFAFKFTKGADSWFEASNVAVGNYTDVAVSCWITIDAEFFNDPAPGTSETQHIIDKYAFVPEGGQTVQKGYRLILEKGFNPNSTSIYRRLVFQAGVGNNDSTPRTGRAVIPVTDSLNPGDDLSPNTIYLVMASISNQTMVLQLKGDNVSKDTSATAPDPMALSNSCLLYTSPSPRDNLPSRMPSSA